MTLVAVSKTFPAEAVVLAREAGLFHFGENRIQEAEAKIPQVAALSRGVAGDPVWHLIGHLQTNKAGKAVELFDLIHTIDSPALAAAVAHRAAAINKQQRVLVQVNCSGEPQKSGCRPEEAQELVRTVATHPELALEGFMTIGPRNENPESARPAFQQCRALRDEIAKSQTLKLPHLSMGMSNDLEVAIEEGATLIRLGSSLFGHRPSP